MTAEQGAQAAGDRGTGAHLVALDIDGTVMGHDGTVTEQVRRAAAAAVAAGNQLVVATGRSPAGAMAAVYALELGAGWAVCSNGSVIMRLDPGAPGGRVITDLALFDPAPPLRRLRRRMPDALMAVEDRGEGFRVNEAFPAGELAGPVLVTSFEDLCSRPVNRVTLRARDMSPRAFRHAVDRSGLAGVTYDIGWTAWLDLTPPGVNKAAALETLRGRLGVARERTVAVGDGDNDVEMLRWAGRGVAMGTGSPAALAAADEVTGSVADDGAAAVLWSLVSGRVPGPLGPLARIPVDARPADEP